MRRPESARTDNRLERSSSDGGAQSALPPVGIVRAGERGVEASSDTDSALPTVSVIVPHYRDFLRLDQCLAALLSQTYPTEKVEIIVADNDPPDAEAMVAEVVRGRARLVMVAERGAGPARNGGVAASTGEVLAFTDADCLPDPDWIRAGVRALSGADLVGGRVDVSIRSAGTPTPIEAFELVFAFDNRRYVTRQGFTVTANLFCRRAMFEAIGGFRTGVSEDLEWSRRATSAGYRLVYAPDAAVRHPARRFWSELVTKWKRINAETYGLSASEKGRTIRWLFRNSLLPASAVVHTPRVLVSRRLPRLHDKLGALVVLYRLRFWRLGDALRVLKATGVR